jgi:drug/metabolite transporter (DMT)-like permease
VLLINPASLRVDGSLIGTVAMLVVLAGSLSWSFGSLLSRDVNLPSNPFVSTSMQMLGGGVSLIVAGLLKGEAAAFEFAAITRTSWMALAYLFVFGSIIAFTSYVWLMKNAAPGKVATYAYVNPVVAVLLGWVIADETLNARIGAAMLILIAAVVVITRYGTRRTDVSRDLRVKTEAS